MRGQPLLIASLSGLLAVAQPAMALACTTPILGDKRFDKQLKEERDFKRRQNRAKREAAIIVVGILDGVTADPPDDGGLNTSHGSIQVERIERGTAGQSIAVRFIDFDLQLACSPHFVPTVSERARFYISKTGYIVAEEVLERAPD